MKREAFPAHSFLEDFLTSLDTLRVAPLNPVWLRRYYEAICETLFDMPAGLRIEQQRYFLKTRKQNVPVLVQLECFVEATVLDPDLKKRCVEMEDRSHQPYQSAVAMRYFEQIPDFIKVVNKLSDRYEYNEHIQVFRDCCVELGLQELRSWSDLMHLPVSQKRHPDVAYFELARMIRAKCLSMSILTAISQRRHESNERFKDYCRYIDLGFAKHARLVFIRLDLYYKKTDMSDEATAQRANADLERMLNNHRHNKIFAGWVGYVAKLEYGAKQGVHWHLLIWFDGRVRDGASHVYLAEQLGEYWIGLTNGDGLYGNCNGGSREDEQRGRLGIGLIRYSDERLRVNLMNEVLSYLTRISQLLRPKFGKDLKTIRRGQAPKQRPGKKGGRKRRAYDPGATPIQS